MSKPDMIYNIDKKGIKVVQSPPTLLLAETTQPML